MGIQPALCLGEMQVKGPGLTIGRQQFPDVVHLLARLLSRFELLKRDQRRCQRFGDDPFVVAGNSLFWHDDPHPLWGRRSNSLTGIISPNRKSSPVPLQFSLAFDVRVAPNGANRGEVSQVIALPASPQWPAEVSSSDCAIGIWKIC